MWTFTHHQSILEEQPSPIDNLVGQLPGCIHIRCPHQSCRSHPPSIHHALGSSYSQVGSITPVVHRLCLGTPIPLFRYSHRLTHLICSYRRSLDARNRRIRLQMVQRAVKDFFGVWILNSPAAVLIERPAAIVGTKPNCPLSIHHVVCRRGIDIEQRADQSVAS